MPSTEWIRFLGQSLCLMIGLRKPIRYSNVFNSELLSAQIRSSYLVLMHR